VPPRAWQQPDVRLALQTRDVAGVLRGAQQHTGLSQGRIAGAIGLTQGRVSEIINGSRTVTTLEVFERVADGLSMPDDARMLFGLAPRHPAGLDHLSTSGRAEILAVYPSQSSARADIEQQAKNARTVDVLAVRGLGIIGMNDSLLRSRVVPERAVTLQVLLLDPDCAAAHRRANEIGETYRSFSAGIRLSIERLRDLAADGATVRCHLYDTLPTWRGIRLDSTLFLSTFGPHREGHTSPMYQLTSSPHGALYPAFQRFTDELRRTARCVV